MANEELHAAIMAWFEKKSTGAKKKFYVKDVTKAFDADYPKREIKKAIADLATAEKIMYWSSGSTTMLVLPENFGN